MGKKIIVSSITVLLILICTIAGTYSVIINVTSDNGVNEIVNEIKIRDLVTDDNGNYNNIYYNVKNTLDISEEEANILIDSEVLNDKLQIVLDSIVEYKVNNNSGAKMSNDEIYNLIVDGVNSDNNINEELRNKVISKSIVYKDDINTYLYDIEVSVFGG